MSFNAPDIDQVKAVGLSAGTDAVIEEALSIILGKAIQRAQELALPVEQKQATINFTFGGGGAPIIEPVIDPDAPTDPTLGESAMITTTTDPQVVEIPWPCRVVWCHLYAISSTGQPALATCVVDLQISQFLTWGGTSVPLYGVGAQPSLTAEFKRDLDLTGWNVNLDTGDTITAFMPSFSGAATSISCTLLLVKTTDVIGEVDVFDNDDQLLVDELGNRVVWRVAEG
jgi:hypothetical protein